jgi:glycosyltransferase involved in cell wall biosynthesis
LASLLATRVVACPARGETLANVPFEVALCARHAGPIVLAPDRHGFREQISHGVNGLLYDPARAGALTAAVRQALNLGESDLMRMRRAACRRVAAHRDVVPNLAATLAPLLAVDGRHLGARLWTRNVKRFPMFPELSAPC